MRHPQPVSSVDRRPAVLLTDPRALRAYAHPVRRRALALLRSRGTLTATEAADALGESSGTMSFHLRQLAKYGLVEEAPSGKGRQKPWRATSLTTGVPGYVADPDAAQAARDLKMSMAQLYLEQVMEWIQTSHESSPEWQEAADFGDNVLYLTADELVGLRADVQSLLEPYARRYGEPEERPPDARRVSFLRFTFPAREVS